MPCLATIEMFLKEYTLEVVMFAARYVQKLSDYDNVHLGIMWVGWHDCLEAV